MEMIMRIISIILIPVFMSMFLAVAFGFQQPEVLQLNVTKMRNTPSEYEGKPVQITGFLYKGCGLINWSLIENDYGYIQIIHPDWIESGMFTQNVQKDDLFKKLWDTCTADASFIPCKKNIEVEVEGFVKDIKEIVKERYPDATIEGILVVTRVIRVEEKYRKPHSEMCIEETSDEILEKYRLVPNPAVVALSFQPPEIIQPNIAEMRRNPSKYQGKLIKVVGWLKGYASSIEDDEGYISIRRIEPDTFVNKDSLFEKLWTTNANPYIFPPPCQKDIEVEVEGFVKEGKEVISGFNPEGGIQGVLVVTRVIRIEEKYRTPPVGICAPEEPEHVVPPTIPDWIKPERKELNFFEGIRDTKAE